MVPTTATRVAGSDYEKYDFQPFEGIPRRLFLPMATVKRLFR